MLRLIDANLDRLGEGLRVLEDIARFTLGNTRITEKLKAMRHELITVDPALRSKLLTARDSERDVGREGVEEARENVIALVTANAKRAQESLRVLEEFAKLPEMHQKLEGRKFEQARFTLYEIEKEITLRLVRQDKKERISGLYVIIDTPALAGRSEAEATRQVISGGVKVVQLRDKHRNRRELVPIAHELKQICAEANVLFIVNDYIDIALATDADGVHLGQSDLPVHPAREILPLNKLIGCSVRTVEQALQAQEEGADYIGLGSIYHSPTKPDAEVIGLERLRQVKKAISLPVIALGGINEGNVDEVLDAGADSVAVIGAVLSTEDIQSAAGRIAARIDTISRC